MELEANVFLPHTSQTEADRWFDCGRFWQIPTDLIGATERVTDAVRRQLRGFGLETSGARGAQTVLAPAAHARSASTTHLSESTGVETRTISRIARPPRRNSS